MSILDGVRTVLLAHAHPDDETISSGALVAELAARGIRVVLLTATLGEQGEVVLARQVEVRAALGTDPADDPAGFARLRERELGDAAAILGVAQRYLLGTAPARARGLPDRRYADSGMRWIREGLAGPAADVSSDALTAAPLAEVTDDIGALIELVSPQLVISYDDNGGYGHPDHRRIREAALAAATATGIPFAELLAEPAPDAEWLALDQHLATVQNALRSHASQITVDGDHLIHSGGQREKIATAVGLRVV
ncbi:PIG-L family deacetylase [Rathayibacter soli]|uniref:PIG-L family deacetylase n=1 Tax=Rathayibacter soli TaxID=3144168 RepID=UPI0027E45B06|nr:PIG-L family deacetylase [Glaciibacter superstes]